MSNMSQHVLDQQTKDPEYREWSEKIDAETLKQMDEEYETLLKKWDEDYLKEPF